MLLHINQYYEFNFQISELRAKLIEGYFLSNVLYSFGVDWVTWVEDQIGGNVVSHMHNLYCGKIHFFVMT